MDCFECSKTLPSNGKYIHCNSCNEDYHFDCSGLKERSFNTLSKAKKLEWKCVSCRPKNKKKNSKRDSKVLTLISSEDDNSDNENESENDSNKYMERLFTKFEEKLWKKMNHKFGEIESALNFNSCKMDELTGTMKDVQKKMVLMEKEQEKMRVENVEMKTKIKLLEAEVYNNAQQANGNKIEIMGLPANLNNEKATIAKVLEKVNGEVIDECNYQIIQIYKKDDNLVATLDFQSKVHRDNIMKKKISDRSVNLKDVVNNGADGKFVYLNEYLTPYYRKLFSEAKKLKHDKNYAYIWIRDGKILLKKTVTSKPIRLTCMEDLGKI